MKKGLPSVASRSRRARSSETFGAPTSDSTRERCSEGENGGSVIETNRGSSREGLEHADEGMSLVGLGLPVAADDQCRRGTQTADDVLQGLDRDLRPVQVVEDEDERLAAGDPREGSRDELKDLDPVVGLLLLGRGGDARIPGDGRAQLPDFRELREEGDQVRGEVGEVGTFGRGARVAGLEIVLDQLAEALVREGPVLLDEAPVEDADLPDDREILELFEQACLSDPGLARHDGELAFARDRGVEAPLQLGEFLFPADEDGARGALDDPARREDDRHAELVAREARSVAFQRLGDLACLLGAFAGILLEATHQDVLELFADLGAEGPRRLRLPRARSGRGWIAPLP